MSGSAKKRREKERREIRNHPERKLSPHDSDEVAKFKAFLRLASLGKDPGEAYAEAYGAPYPRPLKDPS